LLLLMCYEDEPVQSGARIAMSEAVDAAFNQKQMNTEIQTVVDSLTIIFEGMDKANLTEVQSAARNLVPRLKSFIDSPTRGKFFKGRGTIDRTKQLTVFELSGLEGDKHLQRCVLFLIMNTLMTRIKSIPGRKKIYIDEAFDLLKIDTVAAAMEAIYFKGRKYSVSIWIVVQSLLKLVEIKAGSVIMKQSAWKLILGQSKDEINKLFTIDDKPLAAHQDDPYFQKMLKSVETLPGVFSEIMIISKDHYEVVRLYVDKFTGVMFSTSGAAFHSILEKIEEGMDAIEAVNKFIGDKKAVNKSFIQEVLDILRMQSFTHAEIREEFEKAMTP
jgi:conjugal transfer ATP-binding protein TraC